MMRDVSKKIKAVRRAACAVPDVSSLSVPQHICYNVGKPTEQNYIVVFRQEADDTAENGGGEKTKGYSNISQFIKSFQKYEGITPAKYRDIR